MVETTVEHVCPRLSLHHHGPKLPIPCDLCTALLRVPLRAVGEHLLTDLSPDDDGEWWAECACNWGSGPAPTADEALDDFARHTAPAASEVSGS